MATDDEPIVVTGSDDDGWTYDGHLGPHFNSVENAVAGAREDHPGRIVAVETDGGPIDRKAEGGTLI